MTLEDTDGYVKFVCHHEPADAPSPERLTELDALRTRLFDAGLIGMYENGVGFGNVSLRYADGTFVITATATGSARELGADGYCLVRRFNVEANEVWCQGPLPASSETMSHGAVYGASDGVGCVVHVHSHELFSALQEHGALGTPDSALYGTPAMARALAEIVKSYPREGVVVMTGHQDGVLFYGADIPAVASLISFAVSTFCGCGGKCSRCSECAAGVVEKK